MARARFPYAHLDLQLLENNRCYLSEMALEGGINGAQIDRRSLVRMKSELLERRAHQILDRKEAPPVMRTADATVLDKGGRF
jgi:hypothetical protein